MRCLKGWFVNGFHFCWRQAIVCMHTRCILHMLCPSIFISRRPISFAFVTVTTNFTTGILTCSNVLEFLREVAHKYNSSLQVDNCLQQHQINKASYFKDGIPARPFLPGRSRMSSWVSSLAYG